MSQIFCNDSFAFKQFQMRPFVEWQVLVIKQLKHIFINIDFISNLNKSHDYMKLIIEITFFIIYLLQFYLLFLAQPGKHSSGVFFWFWCLNHPGKTQGSFLIFCSGTTFGAAQVIIYVVMKIEPSCAVYTTSALGTVPSLQSKYQYFLFFFY